MDPNRTCYSTYDFSMKDMLQRVEHMPPRSIIIYYIVIMDKTGRVFLSEDVVEKVTGIAYAMKFTQTRNTGKIEIGELPD